MPLECADHLFETSGWTKGAHRGKAHVREIIERYNIAHQERNDQEAITPVEVYEIKSEIKGTY